MIRAAIIEDDTIYGSYLEKLLLQWSEARAELEISVHTDELSFLQMDTDHILAFDIIFIDIELRQLNGVDVAAKLRDMGFRNTIVFVTNYEEYAIDGYVVNAYRYFLKPLKPRDISDCMNFVLDSVNKDYFQYFYHGITNRIHFCDIICFESLQHYIDIHTIKGTIRIKNSLKNVSEQCPSYLVKCHRSFIVNKNYIRCRKGNKLILENDKIVEISRIYSKAIAELMKEH